MGIKKISGEFATRPVRAALKYSILSIGGLTVIAWLGVKTELIDFGKSGTALGVASTKRPIQKAEDWATGGDSNSGGGSETGDDPLGLRNRRFESETGRFVLTFSMQDGGISDLRGAMAEGGCTGGRDGLTNAMREEGVNTGANYSGYTAVCVDGGPK